MRTIPVQTAPFGLFSMLAALAFAGPAPVLAAPEDLRIEVDLSERRLQVIGDEGVLASYRVSVGS